MRSLALLTFLHFPTPLAAVHTSRAIRGPVHRLQWIATTCFISTSARVAARRFTINHSMRSMELYLERPFLHGALGRQQQLLRQQTPRLHQSLVPRKLDRFSWPRKAHGRMPSSSLTNGIGPTPERRSPAR